MKKNLLKFTLAGIMSLMLVFMLPLCVSAQSLGITDTADLLTDEQEQELEQIQQELADKTGWNIAVIVSDGYGSKTAMEFTDDFYDDSFGIDTDGIMFLYDMNDRYLSTSGIAINYLNDSRIEKILNDVDECYYNKDDFGALKIFYKDIEYYFDEGIRADNYVYEGEYNGGEEPHDYVKQTFIGLIAGAVAVLIGIGIVIRRYKFHHVPSANNYLNKGTIYFYRRSDMYIREFTTRTRISSSSGGGGGGSSTHRSSGGGTHGGGGHSGHR